jgi:tetratricopeptide (TPR) repeat protein
MPRLQFNRRIVLAWASLLVAMFLPPAGASAQAFRRGGSEFEAVRQVIAPLEKGYTIVVVEFYHHGEIHADGRNLVVAARNRELVPTRVLQLGPGDFCRVAFETVRGQSEYDVFYGGGPPREAPPPWSCQDGLLLETRRFRPCRFWDLESVRRAFDAAEPIGADYVTGVFHGSNPFTLRRQPFLSRYSGWMDLKKAGTYGLITSSQDCSFLSIDGKLVAAAPGYHGPMYRVRPGSRHDVELSAGRHRFEYDHAAGGAGAVMVAAWQPDPADDPRRRPTRIPGDVFHANAVGHLPAGPAALRTGRYLPDFTVAIADEVPLPDHDVPLVGASFYDRSATPLLVEGARVRWDFGDGQTSELLSPEHVYLRPGLYAVKLSVRHGGKPAEITNRIEVDRPLSEAGKRAPTLDDYLRIVETYDPRSLDAASLGQLVRAYEAKALALAAAAEDEAQNARAEQPFRRPEPKRAPPSKRRTSRGPQSDPEAYLAKAVAAGRAGFAETSAAHGDRDLLELAKLIAPMARARLGDSQTAYDVWLAASRRMTAARARAECQVAAADVATNDLLNSSAAKPLLEAAAQALGRASGPAAARLQRVWGDYYAATGDGPAARRAYRRAADLVEPSQGFVEKTAWLGAHARSTEEFIRQRQFARAAEELSAWQEQFPSARLDGYLTLLSARYWALRGAWAQAVAQAEQLRAANPDSPYADQALYLAAEGQARLGRRDLALGTLKIILRDYPGSPLVAKVKGNVETLERGKN